MIRTLLSTFATLSIIFAVAPALAIERVCEGQDLKGSNWRITLDGYGKALKIIDLQADNVTIIYRDKSCKLEFTRYPDQYWTDCQIDDGRLSYVHQHRFPYAIWNGTVLKCLPDNNHE